MVTLRRLNNKDKEALATLANNKKIWDNLRDYIPHPYGEKDALEFIKRTRQENPPQNFAIEYKNQFCGVIGVLLQEGIYRKTAEIGYWIGEPFWGQGIATKAVRLATAYGFRELKLVRIHASIFEYNAGSMRVLEKNGYEKEGVFKKAIIKNDKIWDAHRYFRLA